MRWCLYIEWNSCNGDWSSLRRMIEDSHLLDLSEMGITLEDFLDCFGDGSSKDESCEAESEMY